MGAIATRASASHAAPPARAAPVVTYRQAPGIQPKLRIGSVDDPLEREADRVAVVGDGAFALQHGAAVGIRYDQPQPVVCCEIGTRALADVAVYSGIDMKVDTDGRYVHKDGSPHTSVE